MEPFWFMKKVLFLTVLCIVVVHQGHAETLEAPAVICGRNAVLKCKFSGPYNSGASRIWRKGTIIIMNSGITSDSTKYSEDLSHSDSNYLGLVITSFMETDDDVYECVYGFGTGDQTTINCTECEDKIGFTIVIIIYGIFAGITVIMWVICCWLRYKKEECCQIWCCIWLIVLGFFAVIAWILWGISYWQCKEEDCFQFCQKAGFIVPIVLGFCAAVAGIIWGIFCCLQYKGIIHCLPPCCGFCVCKDCEEKKEEPDFIEYAKQELQWMDRKIADIKQKVSGGTDAAAKLNKAEQGRLDTCENRCKEEEEKLSKDTTNSYGGMIRDYIKKLRVKMPELKKLQPEGNTLV